MSAGTPVDDGELIAAARSGDEDAFERLVALHADRVYGALRRFGLPARDADDVAQEVFLRAWRGLGAFEGRAQLSTWLYRIAYNEVQRHLGRKLPASVIPDPEGDDPVLELPDAPAARPAARTLEHEFQQQLAAALDQLPHDCRAAVVLRDLEGLSTREAAQVIGVREAAFKSRLHRGRMQLRGLLEPYLGFEQT